MDVARKQFFEAVEVAKARLDSDANYMKKFGLKSKHLCEDRVFDIKPQFREIQGQDTVVGFCFAIVRHPARGILKQVFSVSLEGHLKILFEKPLNGCARKRQHCHRFIPKSELWGKKK
jgi:hypothetical protein